MSAVIEYNNQKYKEWYNKFPYILNSPIVTCKIEGGLGNQLFQISHALCLAWKNNLLPIFEKIKPPVDVSDRPSYWDTIFKNVLSITPFINCEWQIITESGDRFNNIGKIEYNTKLQGYWQTSKYFYEYKDRIKELFKISDEIKEKINNIIPKNCTAIHIRRTDYVKLKWELPIEYYTQCIQHELTRDKDVNFLIFSDDNKWCREHFSGIRIFDYGDELDQFYAMSLCDNIIMANSTFSWWAAFLSNNVKNVYVPEPWFPSFQPYNLDIYETQWTRIGVKFSNL